MKHIQIDVAKVRFCYTFLNGLFGFLVSHMSPGDLSGVEDLGSVNAGLSDGLGSFCFVLVERRRVDLAIAKIMG